MRRLVSFFLALVLVASMPLTVYAYDVDLANGSVNILDWFWQQPGTQYSGTMESGTVTIGQSTETTNNTISVTTQEKDVTVVLENVNIALPAGNVAQSNPMDVNAADGTTVTVELNGNNKLDASTGSFENNASAGLHKGETGNLVIQDSDKDGGKLTAIGNVYAAGIGGNEKRHLPTSRSTAVRLSQKAKAPTAIKAMLVQPLVVDIMALRRTLQSKAVT